METIIPSSLIKTLQDLNSINNSNYEIHLFPDGEYKVNFLNKLIGLIPAKISLNSDYALKDKVTKWSEDFSEIFNQGRISYLNITGKNRSRVFSLMLHQKLPANLRVILSEKRVALEDIILKEIGYILSPNFIDCLPRTLDFPDRYDSIPDSLREKLYSNNAIITSYEINSDSLL